MDAYIDVSALLHVALYGTLFGAGVVAVSALGVVGGSRVAVARQRGGSVGAPAFLAASALAVVAAAVAFGLYVMLNK
ncbi:MAG TPA: hypothetical protein VGF46_11775 [Gaiellales bacterium]|jgi:hypothetical protein